MLVLDVLLAYTPINTQIILLLLFCFFIVNFICNRRGDRAIGPDWRRSKLHKETVRNEEEEDKRD